jgi:DNA polymerase elongation subunit (family B)
LVLDIETCPGQAYIWSMRDQFIPLERLISSGHTIAVGYKWHNEVGGVRYKEAWPYDSRAARLEMLTEIHAALAEADAIVTYNGKHFDLPRLNGEFIEFGLSPLPKIPHIDLYQTVRGLGYISGKLEYVLRRLGEKEKKDSGGFKTWRGFMLGLGSARRRMRKYGKQDVAATDALYTRLRPYMTSHPRLHPRPHCPACGSKHTQRRGYRMLDVYKVERIHCQSCGKWSDGERSKI